MRPSIHLYYLILHLRPPALTLLLIIGVLLSLAEHAGVIGLPAIVILGSWFLKYGFALLDHVIEGHPRPPLLSSEMINPVEQRPLWTFFLLIAFYFLTNALEPRLGSQIVLVLRLMVWAIFPAMVAGMSVTGRFIDALNPAVVFGIISRIPVPYGQLLLGLGIIWIVPILMLRASGDSLAALWRIESFIPGQVLQAIGFRGSLIGLFDQMLLMYLWLATMAFIGGSIYEHRLELGIEVAQAPERQAAAARADLERQHDRIWDLVSAQLRNGAVVNACESVRKHIAQAAQPLDECRWMYVRAAAAPDQRLANYLLQMLLPYLFEAQLAHEAVGLARERLTVSPNFRPQTSEQVLRLARLARDAGDRTTARALLAEFSTHYVNDPMQSVAAQLQAELRR
jgi:hypothetical protein